MPLAGRARGQCRVVKRGRRLAIEPLRVLDDAQQRLLLRSRRKQAQRGQSDQEPLWYRPGAQPERRAERVPLGKGKVVDQVQRGHAQLVKRGEPQLHLGFDAHRPGHPEPRGRGDRVLNERGLPHSRLAAQHQRSAVTVTGASEQPIQRADLIAAAR
jgi:hypothetical protein